MHTHSRALWLAEVHAGAHLLLHQCGCHIRRSKEPAINLVVLSRLIMHRGTSSTHSKLPMQPPRVSGGGCSYRVTVGFFNCSHARRLSPCLTVSLAGGAVAASSFSG